MAYDGFTGGRKAPVKMAKFKRSAALLLLASVATSAAATPAPPRISAGPVVRATPALWKIRDADTTIYLFGTFHTLDGRTSWFENKVKQAFDSSGELVLETIIPADMEAARAATRDEVTETGPNGERKLKPYIASTQTVVSHTKSMGMSVENGADAVLRRLADDAGKPVAGLEKFEEQIKTLSNIPAPPPASARAAPAPGITVTLNDLLGAWTKGNDGAFALMLNGLEAKSPAAYRMLIADRNARWGQWIVNRLNQPGTVFVAVGSGHLAGKDSVQSWLAMRGISAARVA